MKILYVQYANPGAYPAAMRAGRLLRRAGHQVRYLGLAPAGEDALDIGADMQSQIAWIAPTRGSSLRFAARLRQIIGQWAPDWLYIADPMTCLVSHFAVRRWSGGIVYHEHDSLSAPAGLRLRLMTHARNWLARRAQRVVIPNADRAELLRRSARLPDAPLVVWNTPCLDEVPPSLPQRDPTITALRVVYAGSINRQRVPMTLIEALQQVPAAQLTLVGYETVSSRGYIAELQAAAAAAGVAGQFHHVPAMAHDALQDLLVRQDVAFVALPADSDDINHRHMIGASNKSFDAMAQGLALLVGPGADWQDDFVVPGFALSCDPQETASIVEALHIMANDRKKARTMGKAAHAKIQKEWNYDQLFQPVLDAMMTGQAKPLPGRSDVHSG